MDFAVGKVAAQVEFSNEHPHEAALVPEVNIKMGATWRVSLFQGVDIMFADVMSDTPDHFSINLDKNDLKTEQYK